MTAADHNDAPDIVAFDQPLGAGIDAKAVLGGKGAGLAEMTCRLGLPVPPGFTITTGVCRRYLASGWPADLNHRLDEYLERLAGRAGRRFGDPVAPLLVSVRSGAPVSMPGMMDTLLNVGMTPEVRDRLADESGDAVFAADTWLRFCRMYAGIVLGVPDADLASAGPSEESAAGKLAAAARIRRLAADRASPGIPDAPLQQLHGAIEAVFRSWNSERARVFRAHEGIADQHGTAVTVQAMVFGNLDDRSGTGVAFTRDPATGDPAPLGDYLPRAQGEDVVAGTHTVCGLDALCQQLPDVHHELLDVLRTLERHFRDLCDVEFTISAGKLYILQTRIGRRSPLAAVRIAVAMAEEAEFPLTRAEAVARINDRILRHIAASVHVDAAAVPLAIGLPASPGVGTGVLCCDPDRAAELSAGDIAVVLARAQTSPADVHGMVRAAGLITTTGGVASHAAVVARSWAIPAVTSVAGAEVSEAGLLVGGVLIEIGTVVTVDGGTGNVYLGDRRTASSGPPAEVQTLRRWAADLTVESGAAPGETIAGQTRPETTLFELVRVVQLKGLCTIEGAAAVLGAARPAIESLVVENTALFRDTPRGIMLTPDGRAWLSDQLALERATVSSLVLERCYQHFLVLNRRFKQLVSDWQVASASAAAPGAANSGTVAAFADIADALTGLHAELCPLIDDSAGQVARFRRYKARFSAALSGVCAGDTSMLASPLRDSYHTVWFEFHEELIGVCGRDRGAEERVDGI